MVGAWLAWRGEWSRFRGLGGGAWLLLAVAALTLIGNYVFYLLGLHYTTPANAQLLIQAAPLLMALGGILVFGERYNGGNGPACWRSSAGSACSFPTSSPGRRRPASRYVLGSGLVLLGAVVWAVYALAQKQLLRQLSSTAILGFIYLVAALLLWPLAQPGKLATLDATHWIALAYCALNTLGAYGAFAEAPGPLGGVAGLGGAGVDAPADGGDGRAGASTRAATGAAGADRVDGLGRRGAGGHGLRALGLHAQRAAHRVIAPL